MVHSQVQLPVRRKGICNNRRVMFCTCCPPVLFINNTLGIVHLLLMTDEESWQDAAELQGFRPSFRDGIQPGFKQ